MGFDTIAWLNIRKMSVRKSELGNPYVVVHLKNDEPPRSFDIGYFKDRETFLNRLKEKAVEKGYEYEEGFSQFKQLPQNESMKDSEKSS